MSTNEMTDRQLVAAYNILTMSGVMISDSPEENKKSLADVKAELKNRSIKYLDGKLIKIKG